MHGFSHLRFPLKFVFSLCSFFLLLVAYSLTKIFSQSRVEKILKFTKGKLQLSVMLHVILNWLLKAL